MKSGCLCYLSLVPVALYMSGLFCVCLFPSCLHVYSFVSEAFTSFLHIHIGLILLQPLYWVFKLYVVRMYSCCVWSFYRNACCMLVCTFLVWVPLKSFALPLISSLESGCMLLLDYIYTCLKHVSQFAFMLSCCFDLHVYILWSAQVFCFCICTCVESHVQTSTGHDISLCLFYLYVFFYLHWYL